METLVRQFLKTALGSGTKNACHHADFNAHKVRFKWREVSAQILEYLYILQQNADMLLRDNLT